MTLLLWLSRTLFKPILALFDEREHRISGAKTEALAMSELAQAKATEFETAFEKARFEARSMLASLKHQTDKEQNELLDHVRKEAKEKLDQADLLLKEEEQHVRKQVSSMSELLSQEIIKTLTTQKA